MRFPEDPHPFSPKRKKTKKYIYQISLEDANLSTDVISRANEAPETDDRLDHLDCRVEDQTLPIPPGGNPIEQPSGNVEMAELHPVLPWEVEGLSKIERNRIRAREGMRKHREKLRLAKLSNQTWHSHKMPGVLTYMETTLPIRDYRPDPSDCSSESERGNKELDRLKCDLQKCNSVGSTHMQASLIESDASNSTKLPELPVLSGEDLSKKTFEVFTPVAAYAESIQMECPRTFVKMEHSRKRKMTSRRGWLKSEQRFEKNSTRGHRVEKAATTWDIHQARQSH